RRRRLAADQQPSSAVVTPALLRCVSSLGRRATDRTTPAKRRDRPGEYGMVGSSAKAPIRFRRMEPGTSIGMNITLSLVLLVVSRVKTPTGPGAFPAAEE